MKSKFLVSYDITSTFTNILPQHIGIVINLNLNNNSNLTITKK